MSQVIMDQLADLPLRELRPDDVGKEVTRLGHTVTSTGCIDRSFTGRVYQVVEVTLDTNCVCGKTTPQHCIGYQSRYCCSECLRRDWPAHKYYCSPGYAPVKEMVLDYVRVVDGVRPYYDRSVVGRRCWMTGWITMDELQAQVTEPDDLIKRVNEQLTDMAVRNTPW